MAFQKWDDEVIGTMVAGSIRRASSSDSKVWGETITEDTAFGVFVAVNEEGGCKPISAADDTVHGIVVRDIYGVARKDKTANIGHFSHGDSVVAQAVDDHEFKRGSKVYIVATGDDAGKVTSEEVESETIATAFWVEEISNDCVAITLGY